MSLVSVLLFPLALMWPAAAAVDPEMAAADMRRDDAGEARLLDEAPALPYDFTLLGSVSPEDSWQIRIEQRMTIRIAPRAPMRMLPDTPVSMPGERPDHEFEERKMGDCVPVRGIAGVQPERGNRLLFFMRDRRMVSAQLDRSCRAKDFYSGFYLSSSSDGKLCVKRDQLLARSGMSCRLTGLRELVEVDD